MLSMVALSDQGLGLIEHAVVDIVIVDDCWLTLNEIVVIALSRC